MISYLCVSFLCSLAHTLSSLFETHGDVDRTTFFCAQYVNEKCCSCFLLLLFYFYGQSSLCLINVSFFISIYVSVFTTHTFFVYKVDIKQTFCKQKSFLKSCVLEILLKGISFLCTI